MTHPVTAVRLAIVLFPVVVRLPSLSEPRWASDDGFFTAVALAMSHGAPLYSGVYDNSPPGIYWLYRLLLLLGARDHHLVVQGAGTVAVVAAAVLTFEIGRRVATLWAAAVAGILTAFALSLPTLDGDLLNVELAALPFFLGALLLAFQPRSWAWFASGALLGAAVMTRPSFVLDAAALLVPLLSVRDARPKGRAVAVAATAAGAAAALGAAVLALWAGGSLDAYRTVVMPSDHNYLVWANGQTLVPLYGRLAALGLSAAVGLWLARSTRWRLLAVWLPAAVAGASLTPREFSHYVHEAIPPLALAVAILAVRVRVRWRWLSVPAAAALLVLAAEAVLVLPARQTALMAGTRPPPPFLHNFSYAGLPAYYANWLAYASGRQTWSSYERSFPGSSGALASEEAVLDSLPGAGSTRLIVLGDQPWLFVESGLLPASPYIATNSAFWQVPPARGQMDGLLAQGCAVVVATEGPDGWTKSLLRGGYRPVGPAPWPTFEPSSPGKTC